MSYLNRIWQTLRRTDGGTALPPGEPLFVETILRRQVAPDPQFVVSLESRLRSHQVAGQASRPRVTNRIPAWRMAAAAMALVAALAVWAWWPSADPEPRVVGANTLSQAFSTLTGEATLTYTMEGQITPGLCMSGFNTPLTAEEQATFPDNAAAQQGVGTVLMCLPSQAVSETGAYDLERREFWSNTKIDSTDSEFDINDGSGRSFLVRNLDRVFVDGVLYASENGGEWRIADRSNRWIPFAISGGTASVPIGNLRNMLRQYDHVVQLEDTTIDGVAVEHFSAERTDEHSVYEVAEVWVGKDDGIPRKAKITLTDPDDRQLEADRERIEQGFADPSSPYYPYRDNPIVVRGTAPEGRHITWEYTFSNFGEPVDVTNPLE